MKKLKKLTKAQSHKILRPLSDFDDRENTRFFWLGVFFGGIIGFLIGQLWMN